MHNDMLLECLGHVRVAAVSFCDLPKATPIKCLDIDDISGQLKLQGWLYNVSIFCTLFNEEAPFYKQLGRGGTILLVNLESRPLFIDYLMVKFGRKLCPKLCWMLAKVSFYGSCST